MKRSCLYLLLGRLRLLFGTRLVMLEQALVVCTPRTATVTPALHLHHLPGVQQGHINDPPQIWSKWLGLWWQPIMGFLATIMPSPYSTYCWPILVEEVSASHLLPSVCRGAFFSQTQGFVLSQKPAFGEGSWGSVAPYGWGFNSCSECDFFIWEHSQIPLLASHISGEGKI